MHAVVGMTMNYGVRILSKLFLKSNLYWAVATNLKNDILWKVTMLIDVGHSSISGEQLIQHIYRAIK